MGKLKFISDQMDILKVPYEFGEWTSDVEYPYFVGELPSPETINTENGHEEIPFILTGFHRGDKLTLETIKDTIKKHFYHGAKAMNGNDAIIVTYEGAFFIPSGEHELQKIQINLKIQEWKVEN